MNWSLIFSICVIICGALSAIFSSFDGRKNLAVVFSILGAALGVGGVLMQKGDKSSDIPFVTVKKPTFLESLFVDSIELQIFNPDTLLPFRDVAVNVNNSRDINIGTFYPQGTNGFYKIPIPIRDSSLNVEVHYNGTEKYFVKLNFRKISEFKLAASYTYQDGKVKFKPAWKKEHESVDTLRRMSFNSPFAKITELISKMSNKPNASNNEVLDLLNGIKDLNPNRIKDLNKRILKEK